MTVIQQKREDSIEARVYESDGKAKVAVYVDSGPVTQTKVLNFPLTEENLSDLRSSRRGGISTSSKVYDIIGEAIYETEYSGRLP